MKTTISGQLLSGSKTLEETLGIIKSHGVRRIELWPNNFPVSAASVPHLANRYEGRDIPRTKALLAQYGIEAVCLSLDGEFNPIAQSPVDYVKSFFYALDVCVELKIGFLNHYCYHFALGPDADYLPYLKMLEPVVRRAEDLGVTLVLENEAHDATARPQRMREILQTVASDRFMTNYDATNYYHASQEGFPAGYDLLKPYIKYVHLKNGCLDTPACPIPESKGGPFSGSLEPGSIYYPPIPEGAVNIAGLAQRLATDGYTGYCTIEPHTSPAWADHYYRIELDYLRKLNLFQF